MRCGHVVEDQRYCWNCDVKDYAQCLVHAWMQGCPRQLRRQHGIACQHGVRRMASAVSISAASKSGAQQGSKRSDKEHGGASGRSQAAGSKAAASSRTETASRS